jgi:nucleoside-diphosphate-sugar epimerase
VSGPDFPSYGQILDEISLYVKSPQVTFADQNSFGERKLFSIKKIVEDIGWMPKFSIKEGIQDYFANIN